MRPFANGIQRIVAILGAIAMAWAAARLVATDHSPAWVWPSFVCWCVAVPYWHYLEYRLFAPAPAEERSRFLEQQALSRAVWLGGALVLAVAVLRH